jgi:hypothetical protein
MIFDKPQSRPSSSEAKNEAMRQLRHHLVIARAAGPWQSSAPARALCTPGKTTALRASQ